MERRGQRGRRATESSRPRLFEDSVYALTPRGRVIDLPKGATPSTSPVTSTPNLGTAAAARVSSHIAPLDHRLRNGEVVEIIAGRVAQPSRDWLITQQGFTASPRSRAKVRARGSAAATPVNRHEGRGDSRSANWPGPGTTHGGLARVAQ